MGVRLAVEPQWGRERGRKKVREIGCWALVGHSFPLAPQQRMQHLKLAGVKVREGMLQSGERGSWGGGQALVVRIGMRV